MQNQIFPTINKKVTRLGQVTGLVLLAGNTVGHSHEYLWLVYGDHLMNGGAARAKIAEIEAFGAKVSELEDFVESARWFAREEFAREEVEPEEVLLEKDGY